MDDSAVFIITIFMVVLLFLNFYYISYRNDQFIMASLRTLDRTINTDLAALRVDVTTNTDEISALNGRVTDLEGVASLDIIHDTPKLLSDLNAGYAIMKTNNEKIIDTFYDFNDKLAKFEKQMSEGRRSRSDTSR